MTIKTINVPFFTNPEQATGNGSVNQQSNTKGSKPAAKKAAVKETNNANEY